MAETLEPELAPEKRGRDLVDTCGRVFIHRRHQQVTSPVCDRALVTSAESYKEELVRHVRYYINASIYRVCNSAWRPRDDLCVVSGLLL